MATRNVVVASPAANKAEKITGFNGSNFGDLKKNSVFASLYRSGLEAILSPGNVTLTRDDAELPESDFKVFLVTAKNKSGISEDAAKTIGEEISAAIVKAAKYAEDRDITDLKENLKDEIEDFFNVDLSTECGECAEALDEARSLEEDD